MIMRLDVFAPAPPINGGAALNLSPHCESIRAASVPSSRVLSEHYSAGHLDAQIFARLKINNLVNRRLVWSCLCSVGWWGGCLPGCLDGWNAFWMVGGQDGDADSRALV